MKSQKATANRRHFFSWIGAGLIGMGLGPAWANQKDFLIITHAGVKVDSLSLGDLRALFLLRKRQLPDGTPVSLIVFDDQDPRHRAFATQMLGMFPYVLRESWDSLIFSGSAKPPVQVASGADVVAKVASTRGALGYISTREKVTLEGVKNVEIR